MTEIVQSMYKGHMFYHFVCLNTYTKNLKVQIHVHTSFLPMYKVYIYILHVLMMVQYIVLDS